MDLFTKGWFTEKSDQWPGQTFSLEIEEVLHNEQSKYQHVFVAETKTFGRMMALDGIIQYTEKDQCAYQEMIAFIPLNCHPNPKKVLIIGGGDGGVAREVVKHPCVESVDLCEIDEMVINVSKKHVPVMSSGFSSPKLTVHVEDGHKFIAKHPNEYDVIITDSSDPIGPAVSLFQRSYYENIFKALKPDGITCSQGETFWTDLKLICNMKKFCKEIFPVVDYSSIYIPSYPSGQIGFLLCSKSSETNFRKPCFKFSKDEAEKLNYYDSDIHSASFILPAFVRRALEE